MLIAGMALAMLACLALFGIRAPSVAATPLRQESETPTPLPGTGSIAGQVWDDRDGDGMLDAGEPGLAGVLVVARNLDTDATTSATSGADGKYRIVGLAPALYRVVATAPAGYVPTTPVSFDIAMAAGVVFTQNFGAWQPPTPTPSPTPPLLDTSEAKSLTCGGVYSGDTQGLVNNVSRYGCKPSWDESGTEAVYRLQLSASQPLTITLLNASADLDLFLLRSAAPDSCVAGGDNYLAYTAENGAHYLSVDGYEGAQGSYQFRVDCPLEAQATATPTLTPSPTPTATQTGTPTPTMTPAPPKRGYLPLLIRQMSGSGSIPVTFTLQEGLDGYAGATDTTLSSWEPAAPQGREKLLALFYSGKTPEGTEKAPTLRFDLSLLPSAAVVQTATLRLYVPATPLYDVRAQVQGLLRPWDEATATWLLAAENAPWAQPGASAVGIDRTAWVSAPQWIVEGSRWYEFDVTPLVQQWAVNQRGNHGFVIRALAGDSAASVEARFVSREGLMSFRPQLVVSYTMTGQ
ncbi:MAG: DNRLRE domain-containing protein [Nitrososphaerales archaeon]